MVVSSRLYVSSRLVDKKLRIFDRCRYVLSVEILVWSVPDKLDHFQSIKTNVLLNFLKTTNRISISNVYLIHN